MNREKLLIFFNEEDPFLIGKLLDNIELVLDTDFPLLTKIFFPISISTKILSLSSSLGVTIKTIAITEDGEKSLLLISPQGIDPTSYFLEEEIIFFKIDGKNKFFELGHKDFLGAIMNLGIKRELLGDLIVSENVCYGITTLEIYNLISEKVTSIGKVPISFSKISAASVPKTEFLDLYITSTSLRLDSIVSELSNFSRGFSVSKISLGEVLVNYSPCKEKSRLFKEGDIITIRKSGKFRFIQSTGESKKGKLKLHFKQWI